MQEAYNACLRAAEYDTTGIKCPALVLPHLMPMAKYYKNTLGYIPCDRENESVAKALEYAYDDYCISVLAEAVGDYKNQEKYTRFAKAYELYFDPSTRFMRGLDSKGEWRSPFSPRASNHRSDDYCEVYDKIGYKVGALIRGGEVDYDKVSLTVVNDLKNGYIKSVTFDRR